MPNSDDVQSTPSDLLFIEDALDLASVVIRELEASGYHVTHAENGKTGLQCIREHDFQLVILDWMLPGMDGLEVLRRLREFSSVPVLMLTARDAEIDRVLGLEVGADDYLTKPFSMRELIARVRAMLRRREIIQQTISADQQVVTSTLEVGSLRIDPQSHALDINGVSVDLTHSEFALLYLLVRNAGRVFSRAYLLETIWSESYIEGDRSVDNMVLRLRKKLNAMGDCLETVWGVGYRWKLACHDS
jgi:DNA-binding response OmpR family regulator